MAGSLLAVPAFLPVTFCTGYLAGWITNLHNFRARSLVERFFWSVPLSMAVSAVSATLIYRFFSLAAVLTLFLASAVACLVILGREYLQLRHSGERWKFGWQPLGGSAMLVAIGWMIVVIFSVIDFQSNHNLYASVTILDYSARVNWIESILRTGVPPHNSLYFYKQPATMRNYYFWYVMCAVVSRMAHLPVRAVLNASCVWAGFAVAALNGLYLKHFLRAGSRLRRQFLYSILLLTVTGLDIAVILWQVLYLRLPPQPDAEAWSRGAVLSWLDVFLYAPHHLVCLVCCMLAFLLAWMSNGKEGGRLATIAFISLAFASAFGLSVYLSFAFFLLMLVWAPWQILFERTPWPVLLLAAGGVGAALLLFPYFTELSHTSSGMHASSPFGFAIREMISVDGLMASHAFQPLAASHPLVALNLARSILLIPGYVIELGFYLVVLVIYLVPAWRGRTPLTPAHRCLVFIAVAMLPFMTFMRSWVLTFDDFGMRAPFLLMFPLLLLGSELMVSWNSSDHNRSTVAEPDGSLRSTPKWLRSLASLTLVFGIMSTAYQAFILRSFVPITKAVLRATHGPAKLDLAHYTYISAIGYSKLDASVPREAIVQYQPRCPRE